jgi:hypothetical protein
MKHPDWTPEQVAQAYRDQGVTWSEAEIQKKAKLVARELRRMDFHWQYLQRKFHGHELLAGDFLDADEFDAMEQQERSRGESSSSRDAARKAGGRPALRPSKRTTQYRRPQPAQRETA